MISRHGGLNISMDHWVEMSDESLCENLKGMSGDVKPSDVMAFRLEFGGPE
jgi:hypothetical protein